MRVIGLIFVMAALVDPSMGEAGSFFAEMPKHAPRMGKRGDYVPEKKTNRMKYFYVEIPKSMPRIGRRSDKTFEPSRLTEGRSSRLPSLLSRLSQPESVDRGGEDCLSVKDLLRLLSYGDAPQQPAREFGRTIEFRDENTWDEEKTSPTALRQADYLYPSLDSNQRRD